MAALNWHDTGKLSYALGRGAEVFCLGPDPREFGLVDPAVRHVGEDVLVLSPNPRTDLEPLLVGMFESVELQSSITLLHAGRPAMKIALYLGRRLTSGAEPVPR